MVGFLCPVYEPSQSCMCRISVGASVTIITVCAGMLVISCYCKPVFTWSSVGGTFVIGFC